MSVVNKDFNSYVKKAIKNTIIDFSRKEKRAGNICTLDIEITLLSLSDDSAFFGSNSLYDMSFIENENLINAIRTLSKEELELLELSIIKGYTDREIAKILSEKENTITKRKNRTLKKLKDILGGKNE